MVAINFEHPLLSSTKCFQYHDVVALGECARGPLRARHHGVVDSHGHALVGQAVGSSEAGQRRSFRHGGRKADLYEKDQASGLPILRDSNTGLALRVGYEFACGLQVNFAYKVSLTNLLDANSNTVEMHPHTLSMGLGYRFGK